MESQYTQGLFVNKYASYIDPSGTIMTELAFKSVFSHQEHPSEWDSMKNFDSLVAYSLRHD